jgi:23S rRNA (uracil1939-C5)-methyltransferase
MSPDLLTVKLEKFTYGGDALGRCTDPQSEFQGRAVFVRYGLPGEIVRIRVTEAKRGHLRGELLEVLEVSPERIAPRCVHFGICGGCQYQHLPYSGQLEAKTQILRDQLTRLGRIEDPPVRSMVASPREWNYRNHVQFHLTDSGKLGFIDTAGRQIVPIRECHLPEGPLNDLWPRLEFDPGLELERVSLRLGAGEEVLLILESDSLELPELDLEAGLSVVHLSREDVVVMAGEGSLVMQVNGRMFRVSAGSFFQVNTEMTGKMVNHLLANLPVFPDSTLLDVYCGVGLFSAFFAGKTGRLIGIESSVSSCEDFSVNLDEFGNVELYEAPAEAALPALDVQPDTVIVDPPRAGLDKRVREELIRLGPRHLAYVSCDPSTLARDAAQFIAAGYQLVDVTPFDLFPQTYHIESISLFEKG